MVEIILDITSVLDSSIIIKYWEVVVALCSGEVKDPRLASQLVSGSYMNKFRSGGTRESFQHIVVLTALNLLLYRCSCSL